MIRETTKQFIYQFLTTNLYIDNISKEIGYVLITNNEIVGYCAVDINNEPAYQKIEGA